MSLKSVPPTATLYGVDANALTPMPFVAFYSVKRQVVRMSVSDAWIWARELTEIGRMRSRTLGAAWRTDIGRCAGRAGLG